MLILSSAFAVVSMEAAANSTSIHISESGSTVVTGSSAKPADSNAQTYISKGGLRKFNPKDKKDADKLASSVEFEVYSMTENSKTHTVFESNAGICYGFRNNGVEITDSNTYYVNKKSKEEYYANIAGGVMNSRGKTQNVQYTSVFNIYDPTISKQVREKGTKFTRDAAERNLKDRAKVLSNVVCQ
ncbi:hypothetical protein A4G18_07595 [Pasteurellaceae bacterium Pebbles2]|nr:hypothetical protein [Pasteurellaceae bacterium Pebbles2]